MRRVFSVLLLLLPGFLLAVPLQAAEWHVATGGKQDAAGTKEAPWDLESALLGKQKVAPGDTVWIAAGTYKYPDAVSGRVGPTVLCRTSELILGPSGHVYRCHSDLYNEREPVAHILDEDFAIEDVYRPCDAFGLCNPCDIKVKTNRFQQYGHTSVDIKYASH